MKIKQAKIKTRRRVRVPSGLPQPRPLRQAESHPTPHRRVVRYIFLGLGLLLVSGVLLERLAPGGKLAPALLPLPDDDPRALVMGVAEQTYRDPQGRFSLRLPPGWLMETGPAVAPHTAQFRGPRDLGVTVQLNPLGHDDEELLYKEILKQEANYGLNMRVVRRAFKGRKAVERTVGLHLQRMRTLDLLVGQTGHHLQATAPRDSFDRYTNLLDEILATYEFAAPAPP